MRLPHEDIALNSNFDPTGGLRHILDIFFVLLYFLVLLLPCSIPFSQHMLIWILHQKSTCSLDPIPSYYISAINSSTRNLPSEVALYFSLKHSVQQGEYSIICKVWDKLIQISIFFTVLPIAKITNLLYYLE